MSLNLDPKPKSGRGFTLAARRMLLLVCLAAACASARGAGPTATPATPITEAAARSLALALAMHDDFHFTGADGPITNVRAELLPFQTELHTLDAQQMGCEYDTGLDTSLGEVWVVTMDGHWPQNFPVLATPAPTWAPWSTLVMVLDANTGARVCQTGRK